jgi:hypothetical protein
MSGIFLTIVVVAGAAMLICGCRRSLADEHYKRKKAERAQRSDPVGDAEQIEIGLPKKILQFKTAMKDIGTLNV